MLRNLILLAIGFVFAFPDSALTANDTVRVEGGLVSGSVVDGVRSYKGIPFAAPPVGELRWKAPQPVAAWEGVRKGDDFGPDCPQAPYPQSSIYYSAPRRQSEDCLCLKEDRDGRRSAEKAGEAFAKAAGADSIKALRALPAEKIVDVFNNNSEGRNFRTGPNVDGWALPDEIRNIFAQGKQNDAPVIVGSNANEMTTLTAPAIVPKTLEDYRKRVETQYGAMIKDFDSVYPVKSEADIADAFLGGLRDSTFTLPMRTWARMTATGRSKAYLYFFSHVPPNPNSKYLGAYHAGEIVYVFNNLNRQDSLLQEADFKLAEMMSNYWVNFATTGDPNGKGLPKWTPYNSETEAYLDFGDAVQLRNHLLKAQLDFIERFQARR